MTPAAVAKATQRVAAQKATQEAAASPAHLDVVARAGG